MAVMWPVHVIIRIVKGEVRMIFWEEVPVVVVEGIVRVVVEVAPVRFVLIIESRVVVGVVFDE
jgi:hypothetical protein